jgi:uncharacterized protein YbjT (DUF2867 family)
MIVVTGATGTIGKDVVKELREMDARFRVVARDPEKARKLLGDVQIVRGDLGDRASLDAAFEGGTKLFLLGPGSPTQVADQHNAIEAAKAAGVTHVVRSSAFVSDQESAVSLGRWHGQTDNELRRSGLKWTILQPEAFMQNLLGSAGTIKQQGAIYGTAKDGKIAMIDARDIARVAARALVDPGHEGKTYVLTGPEAIDYARVAETFSHVLGRPVKYVDLAPEQARLGMLGTGLPEWLVDILLALSSIYAAGRGARLTDAVEQVGGTKPRTIAQFVRDHVLAFA